jgi:lipopolysaccharide/colanic/teichoic acid biosynthesis glycosyltransferase
MIRRVVDIAAAGSGLLVLSPCLMVVALLIAATSPGGVFFAQERVGCGGRPFRLLKFRTMRLGIAGPQVTAAGDARITSVGRVLRRLKLDEFPQLWNVLRGDMSLVGPRPEVPKYVALYPSALREAVLAVRPGITDPLSLELFDESALLADADDPERYYVEVLLPWKVTRQAVYVSSRTLAGDIRVVAQTIMRVVGLPRPAVDDSLTSPASTRDRSVL